MERIDLDEYFKEHPEEEQEFLAELERLYWLNEQLDYPDHEFQKGASYANACGNHCVDCRIILPWKTYHHPRL